MYSGEKVGKKPRRGQPQTRQYSSTVCRTCRHVIALLAVPYTACWVAYFLLCAQ